MKFERPKPNGDFIMVQLDANPNKVVKIGASFPPQIQTTLIKCLKAIADIFATSPKEMSGIDPAVACHRLNVNPNMKYVAQRRRRQTPQKAKVVKTIVGRLIQEKFSFEIHYTEWLSNVVLVKKTSGECVLIREFCFICYGM
jgi:hypothetical protein